MNGEALLWLPDILSDAGLRVVTYGGWDTRSRSSGGFTGGTPFGVFWHHTASDTSPDNDANYMCYGSDSRPIANLLMPDDGSVWVLAAGATNTNGKGKQINFSRGVVPVDSANTKVVGMEIANSGTGEAYEGAQIDACFIASNAINRYLGNQPTDISTHQFYAPDRKIDPATTGAVQGFWRPAPVAGSTWSNDSVKAECQARWGGLPPTPPDPGDDDDVKACVIAPNDDPKGPWLWWDGQKIGWIRDAEEVPVGRVMGLYSNASDTPLNNFNKAQIKLMIESGWAGGPKPPGY